MAIADQVQVEAALDGFTVRLRAVLDRAMEDWQAMPNKPWFFYPRDKSNFIFSQIARHALAEFEGDSDVHVVREPQTVKFLFLDRVLARFKKGNARGVGSNIETQAVLDFIDPQGSFAGLPDVHRVEIVYQLNILGTGFAEVAVVARNQRTRVWAYPLTGRPSADIIPMPTRTPPILTPPVVTAKPPADEKTDEEKPAE